MELAPMNLDEFEIAIRDFAAAFNRKLGDDVKLQYFRVLSSLGKERLTLLFNWAVETLDSPLPTIARLRQRAVELGWLATHQASGGNGTRAGAGGVRCQRRDERWFVRVTCPKCGGEFMVRKTKLQEDARADAVYGCANGSHWGCPETFRAVDIQNLQLKEEV